MKDYKMNYKKVRNNLILTFSAQATSILANFVLNIITPRYISEYQYAYWQTFILYLSYVGILHFGLLDGLVLRYSQYDYDELDKQEIRSQFYALLLMNTICSFILISISSVIMSGVNKKIFLLVAIGIITKNIYTYNSYTFQITNRIKLYAFLIIAQRLIYGFVVVVLLLLRVDNWMWYCIADLLGDLAGIVACCTVNREICFGNSLSINKAIKITWESISAGIKLLVATWASMFLVGSAKMIIQWRWDELVFGKVSFAFSIMALFMTFINAISVVLFPILKRMKEEDLPNLYSRIRGVLSPLLIVLLSLYFPGCMILKLWLPKYIMSLQILSILLPSVIYTSKVNLLTSNYLKAYRKETVLLIINLSTIIISFGTFLLFAFVFNSLNAIIIATLAGIAIRSIASEIVVSRLIGVSLLKDHIAELIITIIFIICANINKTYIGFIVYFSIALVYTLLNSKLIMSFFNKVSINKS
ncbi:hypothetical protein [Ruminococcus sp.]|uniref:lipopolysaccharide biosynthesis protein n=1 Tax=Ruminococcus sp. TaxID=41978 RepID=UPI0025CFE814|nr:hypothetical protein [Ruminococcus sp.]